MSINRELHLDRPIRDQRHETVLNVVRTGTLLSRKGERTFQRFGLSEAQFNVLFALKYKEHDWTQTDLGKRLLVTRASVTSVLDKLEGKELVSRQPVPGDRRSYHVALTVQGRRLIDQVEPCYRQDIQEVLAGLESEECQALIGYLERIRSNCDGAE